MESFLAVHRVPLDETGLVRLAEAAHAAGVRPVETFRTREGLAYTFLKAASESDARAALERAGSPAEEIHAVDRVFTELLDTPRR